MWDRNLAIVLVLFLTAGTVFAQPTDVIPDKKEPVQGEPAAPVPPPPNRWQHESEASVVLVSGNTSTEAYNAKQTTSYTFGENKIVSSARYRLQSDKGTRTAKSWMVMIRYERSLSERVAVFVAQTVESDIYAGTVQRNSSDLGMQYFFIKSEYQHFLGELGYRPAFEIRVAPAHNHAEKFGRAYLQWERAWSGGFSHRIWVEYLPNFDTPQDYLLNTEPSIDAKLTEIFRLRVGYLVRYRGQPPDQRRRLDTTYSTTLVAKF